MEKNISKYENLFEFLNTISHLQSMLSLTFSKKEEIFKRQLPKSVKV